MGRHMASFATRMKPYATYRSFRAGNASEGGGDGHTTVNRDRTYVARRKKRSSVALRCVPSSTSAAVIAGGGSKGKGRPFLIVSVRYRQLRSRADIPRALR